MLTQLLLLTVASSAATSSTTSAFIFVPSKPQHYSVHGTRKAKTPFFAVNPHSPDGDSSNLSSSSSSSARPSPSNGSMSASTSTSSSNSNSNRNNTPTTNKNSIPMSTALPFFACPTSLIDCDLAGNVGFDPLGLAATKEALWNYRESEIKHARLAMLAAAGWPASEWLDRPLSEYLGAPVLLDAHDRVPSLLNGGLGRVSPVWWGFCVGLTAAIDMYGIAKARAGDPSYVPGNLGFDPLNLYPVDRKGRDRMQLAEIKHGRLAMIAVAGYAVQEYVTKGGVVDEFLPAATLF